MKASSELAQAHRVWGLSTRDLGISIYDATPGWTPPQVNKCTKVAQAHFEKTIATTSAVVLMGFRLICLVWNVEHRRSYMIYVEENSVQLFVVFGKPFNSTQKLHFHEITGSSRYGTLYASSNCQGVHIFWWNAFWKPISFSKTILFSALGNQANQESPFAH